MDNLNTIRTHCALAELVLFLFGIGLTRGWIFSSSPNRVCYGDLGCFSNKPPHSNTPGVLPHGPEVVGTRFLLYSRNSTHRFQELVISGGEMKCSWRTFCRNRETKLIIHGYFDSGDKPWVKKMVKALLKYGRKGYNIIVVDWKPGARDINYLQSAANIRLVGAQVAQLIKVLMDVYTIQPGSVHIIGHSLGAHAAGYAGEYLDGIGRITGLDPAGPSFEGFDPAVRLDESDAEFVDVIHTDGEHLLSLGWAGNLILPRSFPCDIGPSVYERVIERDIGFGLMTPIGHVDFYPNGGTNQPGCPTTYFAQMRLLFSGNFEIVKNFACSHLRVLDLFTESINSKCTFKAYPCKKATDYKSCTTCGRKGCIYMGHGLEWTHRRGIFSVPTYGDSPFCMDEIDVDRSEDGS